MTKRRPSRATSTEVDLEGVRRALLAWFRRGHRDMPWRKTRDPYAIWVSEIMLQQTRVETVRTYYERWMARLPTVRSLAEAPLDEVLSLWSGLGYYARARNLKAAAEVLVAKDGGVFPRDPARIGELPGIGPYTAGAISSIAFDLPEPILDGNVARILSRIFLVDAPAEAASTKAALWTLARSLVPARGAGDFNQAMMELGATVCVPRDPACLTCPVAAQCKARAAGRQVELPRKKQKRATPTVAQLALLVRAGERVLLARRPARGLWGGLWEPPCLPMEEEADPRAAARSRYGVKLLDVSALQTFTHELTHRRYLFQALTARSAPVVSLRDESGAYEELRWFSPKELGGLGLSAWASRLLDAKNDAPLRRARNERR